MPITDTAGLVERLREACSGHPHAEIAWPHRLLHDAADEIERLRALLREAQPHVDRPDPYAMADEDALASALSARIDAALSGTAGEGWRPIVPDGWQLVPKEPTVEMIRRMAHKSVADRHTLGGDDPSYVNEPGIYRAALAAAPEPPLPAPPAQED